MSNRRRTSTDRAHPRAHPRAHAGSRPRTGHTPPRRSRPFGGRPRGGPRSYAVLRRLHAMPRWTVPVATVVLFLVGMTAGPVVGGLCLAALAAFLGWLSFLAWPELGRRARVVRALVLGMLTGVAVVQLFGLWG